MNRKIWNKMAHREFTSGTPKVYRHEGKNFMGVNYLSTLLLLLMMVTGVGEAKGQRTFKVYSPDNILEMTAKEVGGTNALPTQLQSPFCTGFTYYGSEADAIANQNGKSDASSFATDAEVYVKYTYDESWFAEGQFVNATWCGHKLRCGGIANGSRVYANDTNEAFGKYTTWKLTGTPYAMQMHCVQDGITGTTVIARSLSDTGESYMRNSDDATYTWNKFIVLGSMSEMKLLWNNGNTITNITSGTSGISFVDNGSGEAVGGGFKKWDCSVTQAKPFLLTKNSDYNYPDPQINKAPNGMVTITYDAATDVYYTTDGSTPTIPALGEEPQAPTMRYTAPFSSSAGMTIKAIAAVKTNHSIQSANVELVIEPTSYAIYVADNGYLKNVNNEHELDFNNFAPNSKWIYTAEGKLQCGSVYLKDNGATFTTTTDASGATAWTLETDANNSAKHYFKSGDKYMRSGWVLSDEYAEGYTTDDRYGAYEVRGTNNNVVWIANGTYVIQNRKVDYLRNDKNPPNLLYPSESDIKLNHDAPDAIAQWEITVDADGYYTFKNVSTGKYMECASGTSNCAITSTTATEDKFKFSLKLYGPSNKWTDWNKAFNGNDCTTYPSLYAPWFYSICPKTGNNDNTGLNAPQDNPTNKVKSVDSNNKSAGSQWNIIPYELTNELSIEGESSISATGEYSLTATGATILKGSKNPNNNNLPIYPVGSYNDNITYEWSLTTGSAYASLSGEQTVNKISSVKLNVTSVPEMTTDIVVHCRVTNGVGDTWEDDFTITYIVEQGITSLSQITLPNGWYKLLNDVSDMPGVTEFKGSLNGDFHTVSGLSAPLFSKVDGAVIKNVMFKDVSISSNVNAGTIAGEANGTSRIYNCGVLSGKITSTGGAAGGLVGRIAVGSAVRVVNCYNYANISGRTYAAGIVGYNGGSVNSGTRIAMCMMYGNMQGGTSPVYAGNHVSNVKNYTEYNYWRNKADLSYTTYNDQLAIDKDEYLTRFPFYRHILNTHRELAAFFLFGESGETVNDITANEVAEIGHWVLNKDLAPYPIVEEWKTNTKKTTVDIANNLPDTTEKGAGKLLNDIGDDGYYSGTGTNITKITAMGNNGYLTVNVSINGSDYSASLPITDMNEANYDYTWGKVVLPFANEFSGWSRDYSKVCTGWEITSINGGTAGTFANYNVSDRDCTAKDLYSNSGYIFAQGGNYIVPYGVTAINIKAHFANAFYLSDASYDVGYSANFDDPVSLGGNVSTSYHEQTVYTDLSTLVNALSATTNPHDQAIVLVGNYHYNIKTLGGSKLATDKAVTIMSTDEDCNQEPDYGWYTCNTSGRLEVPPLRFDFVPNIEMGMSSRVGSSLYPGIGIWHTRGWFELTETCVSNMSQCEINSDNFTSADNGKGNNRWIANSGCFVQIVRARDGNCTKLSYIQIGGNAYVKELYPGSHTDNARESATVPIAVTGGQVDECYMTGYKTGATLTGDMIYFWCGGGKIKKFLGAYLENPTAAGITAKVDHALVGRFFGGGTSGAARIKGDIDITINNSQVDFYCGGPEFGNMESGKGVTTHAIGTTFGEYYGAGFGGTSITYNREQQNNSLNITNNATTTYDLGFSTYYKRLTNKTGYGIGCCYKFEYIFHSNGSNGVTRFYTGYAQFDLATTGNVTNVLNYCTIKKLPGTNSPTPKESTGDFYGAGCQGKVNGTVTSTLTNCEVDGSAFGGGFKAANNEVEVYPTTAPTYSVYTKETGIFSDFGTVEPEQFTWKQGTNDGVTKEKTADDKNKILYTSKDITLTDLGNVTDDITLTLKGNTQVLGNVFGGGNESKSLGNTTVTLKGNTEVRGNVYGGGNEAEVRGTATVNIEE